MFHVDPRPLFPATPILLPTRDLRSILREPMAATTFASIVPSLKSRESSIFATAENPVAVAPGARHVTLIAVPASSSARASLNHAGEEQPREMSQGRDVHLDHVDLFLNGQLSDRPRCAKSCIVDQHVNRYPLRCQLLANARRCAGYQSPLNWHVRFLPPSMCWSR